MKPVFLYLILFPFFVKGQTISTYAGVGVYGFTGDSGLAINARIGYTNSITIDDSDDLYIADGDNFKVRKVNALTGIITTIAGNGTAGFSGDSSLAINAQLNCPTEFDIAVDHVGNLYLSDEFNFRIRKVNLITGIITTISGNGTQFHHGDGGPAIAASFGSVNQVTCDLNNNLYIVDSSTWIRKIDVSSGIITTIAGNGIRGYAGDSDLAINAEIDCRGIACDKYGNVFFAQPPYIRKINVATGIITRVAGNGSTTYDNGIAALSTGVGADYLIVDSIGQIYLSEASASYSRVRRIDTFGIINVVAGNGLNGFSGDNGPANLAQLKYPEGLGFDIFGNLYFADKNNLRIRKITFPPASTPNVEIVTNDVVIYPNPAYSEINIDGVKTNTKYRLLNITGIMLQSGTLKKGDNNISVQSLPPGMYLLELIDKDGQKTVTKIVKQ